MYEGECLLFTCLDEPATVAFGLSMTNTKLLELLERFSFSDCVRSSLRSWFISSFLLTFLMPSSGALVLSLIPFPQEDATTESECVVPDTATRRQFV
jgi:hypothetical protein